MAHSKTVLINPDTGETTEAPIGYSWTTLFFGFFPALFRGDIKWASIVFAVAFIVGPLSPIGFSFFYNKLYIKKNISSGWKVKSNVDETSKYVGFEPSKITYSDS